MERYTTPLSKPSLCIIGAGGHASSVLDAALSTGWKVLGFVDPMKTGNHCGLPIFRSLTELDVDSVMFALGIGTNFAREASHIAIIERYPNARFPAIVHSSAWISPRASLQEASVVLSMASVGPGASVGLGGLLNTGASLDHDAVLGMFASLGPGARTGGNATIGARSMVGLNAGVLQKTSIGVDTVIGAHSLASGSIPDLVVALGAPARTVRNRLKEDPYY